MPTVSKARAEGNPGNGTPRHTNLIHQIPSPPFGIHTRGPTIHDNCRQQAYQAGFKNEKAAGQTPTASSRNSSPYN